MSNVIDEAGMRNVVAREKDRRDGLIVGPQAIIGELRQYMEEVYAPLKLPAVWTGGDASGTLLFDDVERLANSDARMSHVQILATASLLMRIYQQHSPPDCQIACSIATYINSCR